MRRTGEQISIRISELGKAVCVERGSLRDEKNHNRQGASRREKRLKERTEEQFDKTCRE